MYAATGRFLVTAAIAASAVGVAAPNVALAADNDAAAATSGLTTFTLEGGALWADFSKDKFGNIDGTNYYGDNSRPIGGYGAVSISREISPGFDWRFGGSVYLFDDDKYRFHEEVVDEFDGSIHGETGFGLQTVDFDLGRTITAGQFSARGFMGLRGLHARETLGFGFDYTDYIPPESYVYDKMGESNYWGLGPRVGADLRYGGDLALVGGVSVAMIMGHRATDISIAYDLNGTTDHVGGSVGDLEMVPNLSTYVGANWRMSDSAGITAGYRLEYWDNLRYGGSTHAFDGPFFNVQITH